MEMISVDRSKCKRDGICVAGCPFGLLDEDKDGFPVARRAAARICIDCGHCLAVCPHAALQFKGQSPESCLVVDHKLKISAASAAQFLRSRRSIRTYQDRLVPRETLAELLDISRWAPSAKNAQPTKWLVIESAVEMQKLSGLVVDWLREVKLSPGIVSAWEQKRDLVLRNAPHLVIAYASNKSLKPEIDCTIALTYLELAAHGKGIGACWAGIFLGAAFSYQPLIDALDLPKEHRVHGALMLGYPKYRFPRIPQRKSLQVTWR